MQSSFEVLLDHVANVPVEDLRKPLEGFGRPSVREQLIHVCYTEAAWVCNLQSLPLPPREFAAINSIEDVRAHRRQVISGTRAYLDRLTDAELNSELSNYPAEWIGPRRTPAFILLHIVTHAFHHKGQIVAMLRLLGRPAPDTDMQRI
jgi:uncharacterized damage-inducible protein DinB